MAPILFSALTLGLSAGFSPGPLSTFVITQTLRHGTREGLKVALAPLITDLPIVPLSLLLLSGMAGSDRILGVISCLGALFVLRLSVLSLRTRGLPQAGEAARPPRSLLSGAAVNFLSPNPYLFWMTVGGPLTVRAWAERPLHAVVFVGLFYVMLIGGKVTLAVVAGRSRRFLTGKGYIWLMRGLGLLLMVFTVTLARDGMALLRIP